MADREQIIPESVYNNSIQSKLRIQSSQSGFKLLEFDDDKKGQTEKLVKDEDAMVYITNMSIVINNNCFPLKNNVEYTWAKFIQASKMTKGSIEIFFRNPNLISMQKYLSYKNMNKIKVLLMELLYDKVTQHMLGYF